jgi:ABC-2 type transport system permease protein
MSTAFPVRGTARPQPLHDSITMLGRQLRHAQRYPELTVVVLMLPIVFLLLFVYVFGGTLGAGLAPSAGPTAGPAVGPVAGDRGDYANYVVPAILLMAIASVAAGTSTSVAMDMSTGIIARFRTMSISPGSVLTGHVLGAVLQTLAALVVVVAVALLVGFRPEAGVGEWLAAGALLTGTALAVAWLSVAGGLLSRTVESAGNYTMPLLLLPFLGSGFVPPESMPAGLAWFAEHQPFTPIMDTLRALLLDTAIDAGAAWVAAGWCVVLSMLGWVAARRQYAKPQKVVRLSASMSSGGV